MLDQFGRDIHYLRLSLTERCTLKCAYCRAGEGLCPKQRELTGAQFVRIVHAFSQLGFTKVRLTGGEPMLRRDLEEIVSGIAACPQIADLAMTTNAQQLPGRVEGLKQAGLMRLNISLDSLSPQRYRLLTGGGELAPVLRGIEEALDLGLPVKINTVLLRGKNDDEAGAFFNLAATRNLEVRFIELMPLGSEDHSRERISTDELLKAHPGLIPLPPEDPSQPARCYYQPGWSGRVGFISPISHRFCDQCSRVRVMSDGMLRPCLGSNQEVSLLEALRQPEDVELLEIIRRAVWDKPRAHAFDQSFISDKNMSRIGG